MYEHRNVVAVSRFSEKIGDWHVFVCSSCGSNAATMKIAMPGPVSVGLLPGGDELELDVGSEPSLWISWLGMSLRVCREATALIDSNAPIDPLMLAHIDWELGAFCCLKCEANYCSACWVHWPVFADDYPGWFEETRGRCPHGHQQVLED